MNYKNPNHIEYLSLFSNEGSVEVSVKFQGSKATVKKQKMHPEEIKSLIDPVIGSFYSHIKFDDWLAKLIKVEIQPATNQIIIHAALQHSNDD